MKPLEAPEKRAEGAPADAPDARPPAPKRPPSEEIERLRRGLQNLAFLHEQRVAELEQQIENLRRGRLTSRVRRYLRVTRARLQRAPRLFRNRMRRVRSRARSAIRTRLFARRIGRLRHHPPRPLKIPRRYRRRIELVDPPLISIITPSYNQGQFIEETIRSVLDQKYPRLEYIVQDGGSDDGTTEILERWSDRIHHWESRPDNGHGHAVNLGFENSSGELMAFLNSDDLLLPGSLAYCARYLQKHPDVDYVYGHRVLVDANSQEIGRWVMPRHDDEVLSWADFIPQETMIWRRELWERIGGSIGEHWGYALDWDLLLRFRAVGAKAVRLPRFLAAFRIHPSQFTTARMDEHGRDEMATLRKRELGFEPTPKQIRAATRPYVHRHDVLQKLYRARLLRY